MPHMRKEAGPSVPARSALSDDARAFLDENLALASVQIELARTYAGIGDDAGLECALRRFAAYAKAGLSTFADIKAVHAGRAR